MTIKVEFDTGAMHAYLPGYTTKMDEVLEWALRSVPAGAQKYRIAISTGRSQMCTFWRKLTK